MNYASPQCECAGGSIDDRSRRPITEMHAHRMWARVEYPLLAARRPTINFANRPDPDLERSQDQALKWLRRLHLKLSPIYRYSARMFSLSVKPVKSMVSV